MDRLTLPLVLSRQTKPRFIKVAALAGALLAPTLFVARPAGQHADKPAGVWRGTSATVRTADLDWVKYTGAYESDFWFRVAPDGSVRGEAIASYRITTDDSKLRSYLHWLYATGDAATGVIPVPAVGALLNAGGRIKQVLGVRMAYDQPVVSRRGAIVGSLQGQTLRLAWQTPPPALRHTVYHVYVTREVVALAGQSPAHAPWFVDADVRRVDGQWVAATPADATRRQGNAAASTRWTAFRIGP